MLIASEKEAEVSRKEIENKLGMVGDYVKMDFLQQCLKKNLGFDTRKFVQTKLSEIYESRKMYLEAGKLIRSAAEINTTYEGKMNDFMKSVDLFVKAGVFDEAETSFAKALACATNMQKNGLKLKYKDFYKKQAESYIKKDKRKHALETYEKLASLDLSIEERKDLNNIMLSLYEKLGKVKEYMNLKRGGQ